MSDGGGDVGWDGAVMEDVSYDGGRGAALKRVPPVDTEEDGWLAKSVVGVNDKVR